MNVWTEPVVTWQTGIDGITQYTRLTAEGELLASWPPALYETSQTDCFKLGPEYWIWQPGVGGLRFSQSLPECDAFPAAAVDRDWFERLVMRSWLPAVYHLWGRQVLHASAVVRDRTRDVIAFAGPTQAGKSTIAYGLARRPGWSLVCDDTLAFSSSGETPQGRIALHPLQNDARLRPESARYYGTSVDKPETVRWPAGPLTLRCVYFLAGDARLDTPVTITPLKATEIYVLLLEQAHALTLKIPQHNQRLMTDYLDLAATIPGFRLAYRKSFDVVEEIFDALEHHFPVAERLSRAESPDLQPHINEAASRAPRGSTAQRSIGPARVPACTRD